MIMSRKGKIFKVSNCTSSYYNFSDSANPNYTNMMDYYSYGQTNDKETYLTSLYVEHNKEGISIGIHEDEYESHHSIGVFMTEEEAVSLYLFLKETLKHKYSKELI